MWAVPKSAAMMSIGVRLAGGSTAGVGSLNTSRLCTLEFPRIVEPNILDQSLPEQMQGVELTGFRDESRSHGDEWCSAVVLPGGAYAVQCAKRSQHTGVVAATAKSILRAGAGGVTVALHLCHLTAAFGRDAACVVLGAVEIHMRRSPRGRLAGEIPRQRGTAALLVRGGAVAFRWRPRGERGPGIRTFIHAMPMHLRCTCLAVRHVPHLDLPQAGHGAEVTGIGVDRCGRKHGKGTR